LDSALQVIDGGLSENGSATGSTQVGSKGWSTRIRRRAKELSEQLDVGYMELARILYEVYDSPIDNDPRRGPVYISWGYANFADYAMQELGIQPKKAERLRHIWYTLEIELKGLDPSLKERVAKLGFAKVRELIRVLTLRNAEQWVAFAEKNTFAQIERAVVDEHRRAKVAETVLGSTSAEGAEDGAGPDPTEAIPPPPTETAKQERFDLFPAQLENVYEALKKAEELSGSSKKGHNLDLICSDFLATNDFIGNDTLDNKLRMIAKLERVFKGLRFVVVDVEAKDVVYGIESLKLVE